MVHVDTVGAAALLQKAAEPPQAEPSGTDSSGEAACWCGSASGVAAGLGSKPNRDADESNNFSAAMATPQPIEAAPMTLDWDAVYSKINFTPNAGRPPKTPNLRQVV